MSKRTSEVDGGPPRKVAKTAAFDCDEAMKFIGERWNADVIPKLVEFIEVPNASPQFDAEWESNGLLEQAADLLLQWSTKQGVEGLSIELINEKGLTPLIFGTIEATGSTNDSTILMYGHFDKQPPLTESWEKGLHPYKGVIRDGKLYGRGGADDGYAIFAALTAVAAVQRQGVPHGRIVLLIEGCEESGSKHLPTYMNLLKSRIGEPNLVVCLDSGCGNYEQLWVTTSLRGIAAGALRVDILKEGVHSGLASGIVPSSFRILRQVLSRLEDPLTGEIDAKFHVDIPASRLEQAATCAACLGPLLHSEFPFVDGAGPVLENGTELVLNRTWRPQLSVTGADGFPTLETAGNVLRTHTAVMLSLRLPPTKDPKEANVELKALLEENPPYGAHVKYDGVKASPGWQVPTLAPWLQQALAAAGQNVFGKETCFQGEGGSIPFMKMLGDTFPSTQFVVLGVLGPKSNAHGPNEFLHIDFSAKVTAAVASIVADHNTAHSA